MELIDDLRREHELIEAVAASLRGFVASPEFAPEDALDFVIFFERYAGQWHHDREERVLFDQLVNTLGLPADRGPLHVIVDDHHRMGALLARMRDSADDCATFAACAREYTESLLHHIDAENSVLFPEVADRLRRGGIAELPSRELTPEEARARSVGEALVKRFPPLSDVIRGEGCVMCPAFGDSCAGIEREWWNEWEWEEFDSHVAAS